MYTKQEASAITTAFWTSFGLYMKPIPSVWKEKVNWLNYKTGVKSIYFRMNANTKSATISVDINISDDAKRREVFEQFVNMKSMLIAVSESNWVWEEEAYNEFGIVFSRIQQTIDNVNIFKQEDWSTIISFFKPRIIALDAFWADAKDGIEMVM